MTTPRQVQYCASVVESGKAHEYRTRSQQQKGTMEGVRSLEEAISEVDRELKVRNRCYAMWIADGKLSKVDANDRLSRLQSALYWLGTVRDKEAAEA